MSKYTFKITPLAELTPGTPDPLGLTHGVYVSGPDIPTWKGLALCYSLNEASFVMKAVMDRGMDHYPYPGPGEPTALNNGNDLLTACKMARSEFRELLTKFPSYKREHVQIEKRIRQLDRAIADAEGEGR